MGQQKGRLLLIKVGDGGDPEAFTNMAGLRARSFNMGVNEVDTTVPSTANPENVVQRTVTSGVRTQTFSGDGLFDDTTAAKAAIDAARTGVEINCQVVVPGYGTFEGPFIISNFEFSGDMEENLSFSATWSAANELTFTAAV